MENKPAKELIDRYLSGTCTEQEKGIVETWFNGLASKKEGSEIVDFNAMNERIISGLPVGSIIRARKIRLWPRVAAAASIILCIGAGIYYYGQRQVKVGGEVLAMEDVRPGGNKAFLTLADGKRISLTDASNGVLAEQAGVKITKTADGQVIYSIADIAGSDAANKINLIETPRGGEYQVRLPDGSKVWLNAASSIKFPASFASLSERRVELNGEAYFEVAKDKLHPFIVKSMGQEVQVLGTHFNVNAYADETVIKTTLLEGSVKVGQLNGKSGVLKPGQESALSTSGINITEVDAEDAVAWKNGKFVFEGETIQEIMRKLSRWYDVDVSYRDIPVHNDFSGSMGRFENISQVLRKIAMTGEVHFTVERTATGGRRVVVMK